MKIYKRIASFVFAILFLFNFAIVDVYAAEEYVLNNSLRTYVNADDAANRTNPSGTYEAGNYYIYKEYSGMYNISSVPSSPGGWINPADNIVKDKVVSNDTVISTTDKNSNTSAASKVYITTGNKVNVRTGPSTKYSSIGYNNNSTLIEGSRQSNGWIKFYYNGRTAYTSGDYYKEYTTTITRYTTDILNVRNTPSTSSSSTIIGRFRKDTKVIGIKLGDWLRINYDGNVGYVYYKYTKAPTTSTTTTNSTKVYITTGNAVNVRTGASASYKSLGYNYNGSLIEGIKESNGWIKFIYNGKTAYTSGSYYREYTTKVDRMVTDTLNVRDTASTSSESKVIGRLYEGNKIDGIKLGNWFRITHNGKIGYVYYKYTKETTAVVKPVAPVKEVRYTTHNLNVRKGPSLTDSIIGLLSIGTRIEGVKEENWFKIQYNGNPSYVSYEYTKSENDMPTITLSNTHKRTVTASVNVRAQANTSSEVFGKLTAGTQIEGILEGKWVKFVYGKSIGYIYSTYSNADEAETYVGTGNGGSSSIPVTNSNEFVLVLDPGHGAGIAHNRGGVLFNEGDQNYYFSQKLQVEANKYKGIKVINTRSTIYDNPSLSDRASFGAGADLFLSLHTNAATKQTNSSSIRGVELFSSHYSENIVLGNKITKMVASLLNTPNRGQKFLTYSGNTYRSPSVGATDYWGVFRYANNAKTRYLIEFVFHTNYEDSKAYLDNQDALARNLMDLIADEYGLIKK